METQPPNPILLWWWNRRARQMARCRSTTALTQRFGQPLKQVGNDEAAEWHYPLRTHRGRRFEIRVTVLAGVPTQAFIHGEPVALD